MGKSFRHWLQNGYTDRLAHTLVAPHLSTHTILSSQLSLELPLSLLSPQLSLELPLFISPLPSAPPLLLRARRDNRKVVMACSGEHRSGMARQVAAVVFFLPAMLGLRCAICAARAAANAHRAPRPHPPAGARRQTQRRGLDVDTRRGAVAEAGARWRARGPAA